ncbi:Nup170p [Malassezia vespertilionis]|uniref:Nup170p n=1 Tax=Malassezia vespertilionis TaxID=2020962 RepID=A0A2N1JF62_9BASI|nr:Nup170p [Malassezia vespertilionis]
MNDAASLEQLGEAQRLLAKWCQPGALALPDIKARLQHTQQDDPWASFYVQRRLPIPPNVFETITSRAPVATLALFPEIARACITVENRVYLWDYQGGQTAFEYHQLREDEVVLAVSLVAAKPNVFIPQIKHVLVLSTGPNSVEGQRVTLLGVEQLDREGQPFGIKLYETAMSANTSGVVMRDIRGSDAGRIFCAGSDHCVYELVYQAHEGWFSSRCYLYNVTQPRFSNLVPSFFKSEKKLSFLAVDNARNLLYILREGDQIEVYSLPSKDSSRAPVHTGSMYGVTHQRGLLHSQQEVGQIVWLGPTEPDTRANASLVAVTEKGYRIYFDDFQRRSWAQLAVRIPPGGQVRLPNQPMLGMRMGAAPAAMRRSTNAFYAAGVFLQSFSTADGAQLFCTSTGTPVNGSTAWPGYVGNAGMPVGSIWQESTTLVHLAQGASAPVLAEAHGKQPLDANGAVIRPSAAENTRAARVFLVLDSNGLVEVAERRPADILASLLKGSVASGAAASAAPPVLDYFTRYGSIEACMIALSIAAENPNLALLPEEAAMHAVRLYFGPLGSWPADSRMPTSLVSSKSSRYEALAYYIACIVRSVWSEKLVPSPWLESTPSTVPNPLTAHGRLETLVRELTPLSEFMRKHSQLFDIAPERDGALAQSVALQRSERDAFGRLRALVQRTIQACHFCAFLADHGLHTIVRSVPQAVRAKLATLHFSDLVATQDGSMVANDLVNALIESQTGARASVDAIAEALQARCASFCSADDVRRYKASECLRNAIETDKLLRDEPGMLRDADPDRRRAIDEDLQLSLRLLLQSAAQIPLDKLTQVCTTYSQLGYARGVITLALACARASDPNDVAVAYRAEGCPEAPSHAQTLYAQRRKMYALMLDALQALDSALDSATNAVVASPKDVAARSHLDRVELKRKDAYALATESPDPLCQEELYTWLIQRGLVDQLLELTTPYLEDFLAGTPVLLGGEARGVYIRKLRDLLWQYYVRHANFFAAAQTLDELAHTELLALRLNERIEYLALAIGNAKSIGPSQEAQQVLDFTRQLEEDLEVAQVQAKILGALYSLNMIDMGEKEHGAYIAIVQQLDTELLDMTCLYKQVAEPFELLEEKLVIIQAAQYQDRELVASIWDALIAREHNASAPEHAYQSVAAMVTDLYAQLHSSSLACPLDFLLPRLEQYAYDTFCCAMDEPMAPSALHWAPLRALDTTPIPVGWAPLVLMQGGASPELLFDVLQALVSSAPPPWNTTAGLGFLLPDASAFLAAWLGAALEKPGLYFPAHRVDQAANAYVLKLNTRKFTRAGDDLDARVEQLHSLLQRIKRAF